MPTPEVLSGMRQPRSTRLEEMAAAAEAAKALPTPAPSTDPAVTIYVSSSRRYRVEVAPAMYEVTPFGRRLTRKAISVEFDEGVYRNNHRDPEIRKLIDASLQANKYFGAFGSPAHFWLASDQAARTEARKLKNALETLKSLPREVVAAHMAALAKGDAEDHTLPAADAPAPTGRTARPIQ